MRLEQREGDVVVVTLSDFDLPTLDEALALIADGAINRLDLLEQAGLTADEAKAELERLDR